MLYEAAQSMLVPFSKMGPGSKAWAMKIARHRGLKKSDRSVGASAGR